MDVPLTLVLEFLVYLGFEGKLNSNSDMEKDLFSSALDQLKERFDKLNRFKFFNRECFGAIICVARIVFE